MKYCENCKKEYEDNLNYCSICGNQLISNEEKIKFCPICGKELENDVNFCPTCGNPTAKPNNSIQEAMRPPIQGVGVIIAFMIISCFLNIGLCMSYWVNGFYAAMFLVGILPFCWKIPMTVYFYNSANKFKKVSTSFKICTLLFLSFISGIILLCNKDL